jgi:hypothetical protein
MLFLAVTLGFFVENQREHLLEYKRAKQYARSLIQDLSEDTLRLGEMIQGVDYWVPKIDSFILLATGQNQNHLQLYYYSLFTLGGTDFTPNSTTLQQLKGAGTLRYFHDPEIEDKISEYSLLLERYKEYKDYGIPIDFRVSELWNNIFDGTLLGDMSSSGFREKYLDGAIITFPTIFINSKDLPKEYVNAVRKKKVSLRFKQKAYYKPAFQTAVELIAILKKEYHLSERTHLEK